MADTTVFVLKHGRRVLPSFKREIIRENPHDNFDQQDPTRPKINIRKFPSDTDIRLVVGFIESNRLRTDVPLLITCANHLIYHFLESVKSFLDGNWVSHGVTIGTDGEEITPLKIIEWQIRETQFDQGTTAPSTKDGKGVALNLLCYYRLKNIDAVNQATYRNLVIDKIKSVLTQEPLMTVFEDGAYKQLAHMLKNDSTYMALVGCLDQFLVKFPSHPGGPIRIGTLTAYMEDSAGVSLLTYMETLCGSNANIVNLILTQDLREEFMAFLMPNLEANDPSGYTPYMRAYMLVRTSPLSITALPNFFFLTHTIGYLMGKFRSYNARWPAPGVSNSVLIIAASAAFVMRDKSALRKQIFLTENECTEAQEALGDGNDEQSSFTADEILKLCSEGLRQEVKDWINAILSRITTPMREESFGVRIKQELSSLCTHRGIITNEISAEFSADFD